MKKKILALCLVVALAATAVIGGTLAYFTDTKEATNTFTVGNVEIKLDEAVPGEQGKRTEEGVEYTGIVPGVAYGKDPIVTNTGANDAYVRLKVRVENGLNWMGLYGATNPSAESNFTAMINNTLGADWEVADIDMGINNGLDGMSSDVIVTLNYTKLLAPDAKTPAAFTEFKLPDSATAKDITTRISQDGSFAIVVTAEAIQAEGFNGDYAAALAALDA